MKCVLCVVVLFAGVAAEGPAAAPAADEDKAMRHPVSKLVTLLRNMQQDLRAEAEKDEELYDKLACFCETNDKAKTKAIDDAEARIADLTTTIESLIAQSQRLNVEIDGLNKEIAQNQESLATATAIRNKQSAEFQEEEKEMLVSIQALKDALVVLGKHYRGSALLDISKVAKTVNEQIHMHRDLLDGVITPSQRDVISAFAQQPQSYWDATPTYKQAYAPQGSQVFGILKQMKETFEENLVQAQKDEKEAQDTFATLKAAKEDEILTGQNSVKEKTQLLATADQTLAQAKEDREDTAASLSADEKYLADLKQHCSMTDKEWEDRQKFRADELTAVAKAIEILTTDDARELFSKTFNPPSFVQTGLAESRGRRDRAADVLRQAAAKASDPRLSSLAVTVRLHAFTRVKKAIDDMVAQLLQEADEEVNHKAVCVDDLNTNERQTEAKSAEKVGLETKIEGLKNRIEELDSAIQTLKNEIADLKVQQEKAGKDRDTQHQEFQVTVKDQRDTQALLKEALVVLKDAYAKSLLQKGQAGAPAPVEEVSETVPTLPPKLKKTESPWHPDGFDNYAKNQAAGGILAMLEQIITDAKLMEKEAMQDEAAAQAAYAEFVQETNVSIDTKEKGIVNKTEDKAMTEQDLTEATSEHDASVTALENLASDADGLHQNCDFILKNFDARQKGRAEEVEALRQAKAFLSGMQAQ